MTAPGAASSAGLQPLMLAARRVVVTGASRGIGAAIVEAMATAGAEVVCCARDGVALNALVEATKRLPGSVRAEVADLSDWAQLDTFVDGAAATLGGVDVLVNNAGQVKLRDFLTTNESEWERTLRINLLAAVRCARRVIPGMIAQGGGRIVMMASSGSKYPEASWIDYAASKAGLAAVTTALAREYAHAGVLVNAICPGVIDTPMWAGSTAALAKRLDVTPDEVRAGAKATIPMGRFGTAAEVAELVLFLASDRSTYLSGAAIDLDGALATHVF